MTIKELINWIFFVMLLSALSYTFGMTSAKAESIIPKKICTPYKSSISRFKGMNKIVVKIEDIIKKPVIRIRKP